MGTNKIGREKYIGEILVDNITHQDIYKKSNIDEKLDEYFALKKKIEYGDQFKSNYDEIIEILKGQIKEEWEHFKENKSDIAPQQKYPPSQYMNNGMMGDMSGMGMMGDMSGMGGFGSSMYGQVSPQLQQTQLKKTNDLNIRYNKLQKEIDDYDEYNPTTLSVTVNGEKKEQITQETVDKIVKKLQKGLNEIEKEYKENLHQNAFIKNIEKDKNNFNFNEEDYIKYLVLKTFFKGIGEYNPDELCTTDIFKCFYDNYTQAKALIERERTKYNAIISDYIKLVDKSPYDYKDERFIKYLNYIKRKILEAKDIYINDNTPAQPITLEDEGNDGSVIQEGDNASVIDENDASNASSYLPQEGDGKGQSVPATASDVLPQTQPNTPVPIQPPQPIPIGDNNIPPQPYPLDNNNIPPQPIPNGDNNIQPIVPDTIEAVPSPSPAPLPEDIIPHQDIDEDTIIMPPPFPLFINMNKNINQDDNDTNTNDNNDSYGNNIYDDGSIIMPPPFPLFINKKQPKKQTRGTWKGGALQTGTCNMIQNIIEDNDEMVRNLDNVKDTIDDIIYNLQNNLDTIVQLGDNCETINDKIKLFNSTDILNNPDITSINEIYISLNKYSQGSENISKLKTNFSTLYDNIKQKILRNKNLKKYIKDKTNKNIDDTISNVKTLITNKLNDLNKVFTPINSTNLNNIQEIYKKLKENKTRKDEINQLKRDISEYERAGDTKSIEKKQNLTRQLREKETIITSNENNINSIKSKIQLTNLNTEKINELKNTEDIKPLIETIKTNLLSIKKNIAYRASSSIDRAIKSEDGNPSVSIYDRLWEKYMVDINDPDKLLEESQDKLYKSYKINNLDPNDALKITMDDKFIFVFIIFIIRQISLAIVGSIIDSGAINSLFVALIAYIICYIGIVLIMIVVINLDDYKLRTVLNFFNFHINSAGIISHLLLIVVFIGVLYFLAYSMSPSLHDNVSKNNKLNDIEIMRLTFRLELITITVFVFSSIIDLLLL